MDPTLLLMIFVFVVAALLMAPIFRSKPQTGRCRSLSVKATPRERALLWIKALMVVALLLAACGALAMDPGLPF